MLATPSLYSFWICGSFGLGKENASQKFFVHRESRLKGFKVVDCLEQIMSGLYRPGPPNRDVGDECRSNRLKRSTRSIMTHVHSLFNTPLVVKGQSCLGCGSKGLGLGFGMPVVS